MTKEVTSFDFEANLEQTPAVQSNLAELAAFVQSVKAGYISQPVTVDNVTAAKKDLAAFRKVEKAIDDKVKGIRRQLLAPYEEYKGKVDEICSELKELEAELAGNIAAVEQEIAEAKKREVEDRIAAIAAELKPSVALAIENYWQDSWTNKTMSLNKIEEDYIRAASEAEATLDAIQGNPHEAQLLSVFKSCYSYAAVARRMRELAEEDRRLAELKAKQEDERRRAEAEAIEEMNRPVIAPVQEEPQPRPEPMAAPKPRAAVATFKIVGTIDEIAAAVTTLKTMGIGIKRNSGVHTASAEDITETDYRGEAR